MLNMVIKVKSTINFLTVISISVLLSLAGSEVIANGQNTTTVNPRPDFETLYGLEQNKDINFEIAQCAELIDRYNSEFPNSVGVFEGETACMDALESRWWNDCSLYYEKIEACYNGKLKDFLKSQGRLTLVP